MNIRPKTVRRLLVLFAGLLLLAGGVALLLFRSMAKEKAAIAQWRNSAFAAYEHHDNATAVTLFGSYVNSGPAAGNDAEAIYAYGMARAQLPAEGNRHIAEAINLLQRYLELAPSDPHDASHQLLSLYWRAGYNKEALTLADRLLRKNPRDAEALRTKVIVEVGEHKFADALANCHAANQIDPTNVSWQDRELQLMAELHQPPQQIVSHAQKLLNAHPTDPRFDLVMADAHALAGNEAEAAKSVQTAASLDPPDALTALQTIALLERGPRPDLVDDLLKRADAKFNDPNLRELSARRLFEREQYTELADRLKNLDPKSPALVNLLAYDAIAQYQTKHRSQADALVAAIASRNDPASAAWATAIRARFAAPPLEPVSAIKAYGQAMAQDHTNAVVPFYLGEARAELGETDEAIRDWNSAARLSPTWAEPIYRISRILSGSGRYAEALMAANALKHRAGDSLNAQVAYAIASWGKIRNNPADLKGDPGTKLLEDFERIRARVPEEPQTLAAYADLLSRRGDRPKAIAAIESAIHSTPPPPESTFEQLLPVCQEEHWDIEPEILNAAEKACGLTPGIAYDRAIALYRTGKRSEALQLADGYRKAHPNDVSWQIDDVQFRDLTGQPDPAQRWKELCDAYPADIRVQYAALSAPFRFGDRAFWQQTIDRVKSLTGADGQAWQIEQARFVLSGKPSPEQLAPVIESLQNLSAASPELGEIHHLLAQALLLDEKPEDLNKATTELTTAHVEQPGNLEITSQLAALLISQGRRDDAAVLVDAVCRDPNLDTQRRVWAAQTYSELGNFDAAINLLTSAGISASDKANLNPLLASVYLCAGQVDQAKSLYRQISDDPASTPSALLAAANFFASAHDPGTAAKCVDRLVEMKLDAPSVELLKAELQERQNDRDAAEKILATACSTFPSDARLWLARSGLTLRSGKLDDADKIAAAGLAAIPSDPALKSMREGIAQLRSIAAPDAAVMLDPVSRDPRLAPIEQTLAILADARAKSESPQQTAALLRRLADRYPRFFQLQKILVYRYLAARDVKSAAEIATRAADLLPADPEPLKLLTDIQLRQGNWDLARAAALRWRQCTLVDPLDADLEIARIDLARPNPDSEDALNRLAPYLESGAADDQKLAATPLYCRALFVSGRADEAAQKLTPLVAQSPRWAGVWMELALTARDADAAIDWLKRLSPLIASDAQPLKLALADTWERVGARFDSAAAQDEAIQLLRPMVGQASVPAEVWRIWAMANQLSGNFAEAQRGWEKLLETQPKDPSARNNLAFALLLEGGSEKLARAESLANEAIAADPNAATFYDTLARIEAQLGKSKDAVRDFRIALEKDPGDVEAMIGLADELQSQPDGRDEARSLLDRINARVDAGTPLMQPIRKQLEHVKTALSSSASPGE